MQKLIVEFSVGDNYTYSATTTLPVLFSSKEEFIILFEEKMLEQKKQAEIYDKKYYELGDKNMSLLRQIAKFNENKKDKITKEQEKVFDALEKLKVIQNDFNKEKNSKKLDLISLGGQEFYLSNFFTDGQLYLPEVFTIDEWFATISLN